MAQVSQARARHAPYVTCSNYCNLHRLSWRETLGVSITSRNQGNPAELATISTRHMQTILVIDDDESLRDTIGVMLEQEGFRAELASDGRSGYDRALLLKPDLMLVDLRLPGMSGVEICRQLRGARVKTPIIVLSAVGDEVDKDLLLE